MKQIRFSIQGLKGTLKLNLCISCFPKMSLGFPKAGVAHGRLSSSPSPLVLNLGAAKVMYSSVARKPPAVSPCL